MPANAVLLALIRPLRPARTISAATATSAEATPTTKASTETTATEAATLKAGFAYNGLGQRITKTDETAATADENCPICHDITISLVE